MVDLSQLQTGLTGTAELVVGVEHTAPSIGSGLVPVLGTPVMINVIGRQRSQQSSGFCRPAIRVWGFTSMFATSRQRR
jgi:hypothetical protein